MENEKYAIKIENVSKVYHVFDDPAQRFKQLFSKKQLFREFWALKNISFEIPKGGVVGIIGRNGSGKSTLLQIIAGTLKPTRGQCKVNGKIAALLELGSGFNPEFTGRENVYMSGSIYGISELEMKQRMSAIEDFADIGNFIDQPVKTYSSGMFARLAFAVNINVDADILIIDEVLSVGDHFFQAKCMAAINELMNRGVTILLVSHSQATVKALCNKAVLFNEGELVLEGNCDEVMDRYMSISLAVEVENQKKYVMSDENKENRVQQTISYFSVVQPSFSKRVTERFGSGRAAFIEAALFQNGVESIVIESGNKCSISVWVKANENIDVESEIGVVVRTFEGIDLFAFNSFFSNKKVPTLAKGDVIRVDFEFMVGLGNGKYSVTLGMRCPKQGEYVDKVFNAIIFDVVNMSSHTIPLLFDVPYKMTITR